MLIPANGMHRAAIQIAANQPHPSKREARGINDTWSRPLPFFAGQPANRICCRLVVTLARQLVAGSCGWEHVAPASDPFILAANHSQKLEALLIPALLAFNRGGRQVHFFTDWNYLLYPGLGWLIRRNDPIVVVRKPAKPAWLNVFQSRFRTEESPMTRARRHLEAGRSVGIFPEGTVNPCPRSLLRGLRGAARLSLETGMPVVPLGIRFPNQTNSEFSPMSLHFGAPLRPAGGSGNTAAWHETIMRAIAGLSGKTWQPNNPRNKI
jgi:1-acyl-sn-glycerol-3-phosphate acyltransferase